MACLDAQKLIFEIRLRMIYNMLTTVDFNKLMIYYNLFQFIPIKN